MFWLKRYINWYRGIEPKPEPEEPELRHWLIIRRKKDNYILSIPADIAPAMVVYKDFIKWFHCRPQSKTFRFIIRNGCHGLKRSNIISYDIRTQRYPP